MSKIAEKLNIIQNSMIDIKRAIIEKTGENIYGDITTYGKLIREIYSTPYKHHQFDLSQVRKIYTMFFYDSLSTALNDINSSNVVGNTDEENAIVAVCQGRKQYYVFLLKSLQVSSTIELTNIRFILNGNTLESDADVVFNMLSNAIIDGSTPNSKISYTRYTDGLNRLINASGENNKMLGGIYNIIDSGNGTITTPEFLINVEGEFEVDNVLFNAVDNGGGTVRIFRSNVDSTLKIKNSDLTVTSAEGLQSYCVQVEGNVYAEDSSFVVLSNHCANAAGTDYGQTGRAMYTETGSTLTLKNCYVYGAHSGITIKGNLYVDGGTYCGYSHGGFYLSNGAAHNTHIKNAKIIEVDLAEGFIDDGVAGTNNAGMYTGAAIGMQIYIDNCMFYGSAQPIVLKFSSSSSYNNTIFISNSSMNKDYTHYGFRNDGNNYVKFGVNNDFDENNLKNKQNFEYTDEDYSEINNENAV